MPSIKEKILTSYNEQIQTPGQIDVHLLFNVIARYMWTYNWSYDGDGYVIDSNVNLENQPHSNAGYTVNCFNLTDLMIDLSITIGVRADICNSITIHNFAALKNEFTFGAQESFDEVNLSRNLDGNYELDIHSVAIIDNFCFDLTLQSTYALVNNGVDIYHALSCAISDNKMEIFKNLLPYLSNIDEESASGWTLLHDAYSQEKYEFAKLLLQANAKDNICDENELTAMSILNNNLWGASLNLRANRTIVKAIRECFAVKDSMVVKNSAASTIQHYWNMYKNHQPEINNFESEINAKSSEVAKIFSKKLLEPELS